MLEDGWTARVCQCETEKRDSLRVRKLFEDLRVPKRYQNKSLDNFTQEWQSLGWRMAQRYVERYEEIKLDGTNGLIFIGPPGTGKTHLAYAILNALASRVHTAICGSVPDLMDMLRPKDEDRKIGEQRMNALKTSELVILDDLGAEKESDWVTERIYMIINARYNEQLPTIITSNMELKDLQQIKGWGRIISRIDEMCHPVLVDGADKRIEMRKRRDETNGKSKD